MLCHPYEQHGETVVSNCALAAVSSFLPYPGHHLAQSHEDTSDGAIHCFKVKFSLNFTSKKFLLTINL